jgi:uncharacterized protein (TIGR03000 family)
VYYSSSHGSWGSYGSSGGSYGSYGSYGSSGGSYGSYGSSGGVIVTPSVPVAPPPPAGGGGEPKKAQLRSSNAIELAVRVPADSKVFVNDKLTTSTGGQRSYTTKDLDPAQSYTYSVRAEFEHNGQMISQTKTTTVSVGDVASLAFDPNEPVTTALTVKVPADAKVYLAGKQTTLTGEQRKFTTTRLPLGQQWANYAIRVEVEREGQTLAKEEKISLQAGDSREVAFEFPATTVARVAER